ncbi:hypothetical protein GOBAR_DD29545 [Gossypium barbadense]|nr:hypothetical protein GOBAR_DD29545 [Gossypium barbadense]
MEEEFQHLSIKEEAKLVIESDDNILDDIDYDLYLVGHSESHCHKLLEAIDGVVVHGWLEEIRAEYRRQIKNPVVPWRRERGKKMLWDNIAKSSGVEYSNDNAKT